MASERKPAITLRALRFLRNRHGGVTLMVAILAPALLLFAGLATEVGLWYSIKRQNQSAVDEGAISGALEIAEGQACGGTDMTALASRVTTYNGFNSAAPNTITVNCPPQSGPDAGNTSAVEVITTQNVATLFASFAVPTVTIRNRAVAKVNVLGTACDLATAPSGKKTIWVTGNTTINTGQCWMAADSNNPDAVNIAGSATFDVPGVITDGGYNVNGNPAISPLTTFYTYTNAPTDPYVVNGQSIISYAPPLAWPFTCTPYSGSGPIDANNVSAPYCAITLTVPATIVNSANNQPCSQQNLCVLYIAGENQKSAALDVEAGGSITGIGVTIISTSTKLPGNDGGGLYISSNAAADLVAPSTSPQTGIPSGLLFYQAYDNPGNGADGTIADTVKGNSTITANSNVILTGSIYTPSTNVTYIGTTTTPTSTCTIIVANTMQFSGNSTQDSSGCAAAGDNNVPTIKNAALVE